MTKRRRVNLRHEEDKDWIDAMADEPIEKKQPKRDFRALKDKKTWQRIGLALAALAWVAVVVLGVQYGLREIFRFIFEDYILESPLTQAVFTILVDAIALALIIIVPWRLFKCQTNIREMGVEGNLTWTDIGLAPVGFIAYMVMALVGQWVLPFIDWKAEQDIGYELSSLFGSELLIVCVVLVVIVPIVEELIFRGWLYGKLRKLVPVWLAVILVSILFGVMHAPLNVSINVFFLSIALCAMREMTGTIYSGILLHMLKNGIALALLLYMENPYLFN